MKLIKIILSLFPLLNFGQNLVGHYEHKIIFDGDLSYTEFRLELKSDSTFTMTKYVYESCYDYTDTLDGKWKVVNENLSFYNIDQPNFVRKYNTLSIKNNVLLIKEKCVLSDVKIDSSEIKLLALNSDFNAIGYLNPEHYNYENETIETMFKLPKSTYQIIYFHGNSMPLDSYFYGGINLVDFDKNNTFEISNCGEANDLSTNFLSPFIQFRIEKDGSLKSLKSYMEIDNEESFRVFKKIP